MSEGIEVGVSPPNRGAQWSDTVGSTLWEGGARRSHPGYRPWCCEDRADRPASPCRRRGRRLMYGLLYTARWRSVGPAD